MSAVPSLELRGATVRFGGVLAVNDVSMQVAAGEVVGLIGPNGAGKTTLLNSISRLVPLSDGTVRVFGEEVTRMQPYKLPRHGVARTFQVVQPFANLTLRENVAIAAMFSSRSLPKREAMERADAVLVRTRLTAKAGMLPAEVTLADRKRLEVSRALAMSPKLLLLDEVMAGLNHTEIDAMIQLIRELQREGTSIVVVEHVMKAIIAVCDRIVVLQSGKKIADGSPTSVLSDPVVVAAYLGQRYVDRQRATSAGEAA
jgi:branched-chain amino acid transport system ATP-binding protein